MRSGLCPTRMRGRDASIRCITVREVEKTATSGAKALTQKRPQHCPTCEPVSVPLLSETVSESAGFPCPFDWA